MVIIKNPEAPATEPQIKFLTNLTVQRTHEVTEIVQFAIAQNAVTKGQAHDWIDLLLKAPVKAAKPVPSYKAPAAQDLAAVLPQTPSYSGHTTVNGQPAVTQGAQQIIPMAELPVPEYGYYDIEGTIYHFDQFKTTYGGKTVKLMKMKTVSVWNYKDSKYVSKPKWIWSGSTYQAKKTLVDKIPMTLEQVKTKGKECTFCIRCGRLLTDPFSVANGIGPVCIKYWM